MMSHVRPSTQLVLTASGPVSLPSGASEVYNPTAPYLRRSILSHILYLGTNLKRLIASTKRTCQRTSLKLNFLKFAVISPRACLPCLIEKEGAPREFFGTWTDDIQQHDGSTKPWNIWKCIRRGLIMVFANVTRIRNHLSGNTCRQQ